ncbi:sialic acid synthase [Caerostris darwini]|uniref:Sialic acid synthase n=1 Tax=Caerostris darwini TaxID=1538125 RepID=A0AAV4TCI1_9ARAC|nr:sialic acid synthase [Caerostris darwini]
MHPCSEHIYRRRLAQFNITSTRRIGDNSPCFIVAEIGQNHQGDISIARRLIDLAANSQVDCVKFQKSCLPKRFTKEVLNQPYTSENSWGSTYGEHRNFLEFSKEDFLNLKLYAENRGLFFAATGMDEVSVDFLNSINVPLFKVGSADATNLPLLKHIARFQKPLFISTGMSTEYEVQKMYEMISKENNCIALLQCTSCYPTPIENVNLNVIKHFKEKIG